MLVDTGKTVTWFFFAQKKVSADASTHVRSHCSLSAVWYLGALRIPKEQLESEYLAIKDK